MAAQKRAAGLLEKFQAEPKAATLKRGQSGTRCSAKSTLPPAMLRPLWRQPGKAIGKLCLRAKRRHRFAESWRGRRPTIRPLRNIAALYNRLKAAFDALPPDTAAIAATQRIGADLEEAAKSFDFNVPADVKLFLEAVLSINGAQLSLLTPSVMQWLENNGGLNSYVVRSTGRG